MLATMNRCLLPVLLLVSASALAGSSPPDSRAALSAQWQSAGLQPAAARNLDLVYVRPGWQAGAQAVQVAPVSVDMRPDWQRASRELEHARIHPEEVQQLKDEIAAVVEKEVRREFADARAAAGTPVLQARVVDLYLNAPELKTAVATKTYTRSFGDMVLVAELRDGNGGPLLLGSWDHKPAREFSSLRLTTRVENAIEVRIAARAWARELRREFDRLGTGG
jgi:hypothetical protein